MKQARMNQHPGPYEPPNRGPNHGEEAWPSFDNLSSFLDNLPSSSLTMDGDMSPPLDQTLPLSCVVPRTLQPLPSMCFVPIIELRPPADLYMSR